MFQSCDNADFFSDLHVTLGGLLIAGDARHPCAVGQAGFTIDKREGDLATPVGRFPLRQCFYRPDREARPQTALPLVAITPSMDWCDDPARPEYNTPVALPFPGRHETLWRDDHCYDLFVAIGYNDAPPLPGKGSAIFFHLLHDDGRPTAGCVAVTAEVMRALLPRLSPETMISLGE